VTLYSVYERQDEAPAVVADRFSWFAAILPPVYALVHGLWLMLVGWLVVVAAVVALRWYGGGEAAFWTYILSAILIGFEAGTFHRRALRHRGWQHTGDVLAAEPDLAIVEALKRK
jgi:ABC-type nickel/cobalt efflux system permease component RcnA